jgi:hypothetical protein
VPPTAVSFWGTIWSGEDELKRLLQHYADYVYLERSATVPPCRRFAHSGRRSDLATRLCARR